MAEGGGAGGTFCRGKALVLAKRSAVVVVVVVARAGLHWRSLSQSDQAGRGRSPRPAWGAVGGGGAAQGGMEPRGGGAGRPPPAVRNVSIHKDKRGGGGPPPAWPRRRAE